MIIPLISLRKGAGNGDPRDGLCLMQAVHWFSGADAPMDHPPCASRVLSRLGIVVNDYAPTQVDRDGLWPLVWQLLDSRDDLAETLRAKHIIREIAHRRILAKLCALFHPQTFEFAAAIRGVFSMKEVEAVAWAAEAAPQASAVVWVAWTAAWAAKARAAREAMGAAREAMEAMEAWAELRAIFVEAIALGRHGHEDPVYESRAAELEMAIK
jgi:hypothetical protein